MKLREEKRKPAVSVVIPMYNCAAFIPELLLMFAEQSFGDFEVISVIDGATDETEAKVKKFCESDKRFRYVVREHGGAGAARNDGIDAAKGKYIIFSDADDIYSKDYLFKLHEAAEEQQAEITVCETATFDYILREKRNIKSFDSTKLLEGEIYSAKNMKRIFRMIDVHIANKLFLLDFIKENKLRFSETRVSNDLFFSKVSIVIAERIAVVHDELITIRRHLNPESISSNRGKYSHFALSEVEKIHKWMNDRGILTVFISDYMWLFDVNANYEMKNGINPLFAKEFAKILNCNDTWKKMKSGQIMQMLVNSFGEKGNEKVKLLEKEAENGGLESLRIRNEIAKARNDNKRRMQEMIKKESLEEFHRDLDDPESESRVYLSEINADKCSEDNNKLKAPAITVVIPMYNCADYVTGVLSMFASQSFSDFEIICVIDGATDTTEELVSAFGKNEPRLRYVVQENIGAGLARNTGLNMARGKYIVFADADDEYFENYLKKLYDTAVKHDAQIVTCLFNSINEAIHVKTVMGFDGNALCENVPYSHAGIDNLFLAFESRVTNKLFKMQFLRDNQILFPDARVSEDSHFTYTALSSADRILVVNDILFSYRLYVNSDSLSSKRERYQHEIVEIYRLLYDWLKDHLLLEIHGEGYFKRINKSLIHEACHNVTPRFVSEIAHMLNAEKPWSKMNSGEILKYLKESIASENAAIKKAELLKIDPIIVGADKQLTFLLKSYKNRIHTAELLRNVSQEKYRRDFLKPHSLPFTSEDEKNDFYTKHYLPTKVRLESSTICQLKCKGCGFQKGGDDNLGRGFLTIENFKRFCKMNPFVKSIEISNYGEPFLNPDLVEIMYYAKARGITLSSWNGSNFNTVSDEQIQAMVDTGFLGIRLSIDGASQETYSKYRVGGDFDKVIENVKKLIRLKQKAGTQYPKLRWGYILMEHNELEIGKAKEMAKELGIPIAFKYNWDESYKPIHRDYITEETGLTELTEAEYKAVHKIDPFDSICNQVFLTPQINWDGRLLGCCTRRYATFDVNVFEVGLTEALRSSKYIKAKECLLTVHPDKEQYSSCTCFDCKTRIQREKSGIVLEI